MLIMVAVAAFVFASRRATWVTLAGVVPAAVLLVVADVPLGYVVLRYVWPQIVNQAGAVARDLAAALLPSAA